MQLCHILAQDLLLSEPAFAMSAIASCMTCHMSISKLQNFASNLIAKFASCDDHTISPSAVPANAVKNNHQSISTCRCRCGGKQYPTPERGLLMGVSPGGRFFALQCTSKLCIYNTHTGSQVLACDPSSSMATWSPDSSALAHVVCESVGSEQLEIMRFS